MSVMIYNKNSQWGAGCRRAHWSQASGCIVKSLCREVCQFIQLSPLWALGIVSGVHQERLLQSFMTPDMSGGHQERLTQSFMSLEHMSGVHQERLLQSFKSPDVWRAPGEVHSCLECLYQLLLHHILSKCRVRLDEHASFKMRKTSSLQSLYCTWPRGHSYIL